jgi:hypothetical protein
MYSICRAALEPDNSKPRGGIALKTIFGEAVLIRAYFRGWRPLAFLPECKITIGTIWR